MQDKDGSLTKDELETLKLKLEVDDLRNGWRRTRQTTVLTAAVTIVIALFGFWTQRYFEHQSLVSAAAAARTSQFFRARDSLTASSPGTRIIAALDLAPYLRAPLGGADADFRDTALAALVGQFEYEDDTGVLRTMATVLGGSGTFALSSVAEQNRFVAGDMAAVYGTYVHATHVSLNCAAPGLLDGSVSNAIAPLEYGHTTDDNVMYLNCISSFSPLYAEYLKGYADNQTSPGQALMTHQQELTQLKAHIIHDAKLVAATSIALESILRLPRTDDLKNADLHDTVLYQVDLSNTNLNGINLANSYITGHADGVHLSSANLVDADLANVSLAGAVLRGGATKLRCTFFSDFRLTIGRSEVRSAIDFAGAPWWQTVMYSQGHLSQPSWLQSIFKNAPRGYQRKRCSEKWFTDQTT